MKRYNPGELEPAVQKIWHDTKLYEVNENSDKPKSYVIAMFPYPSGAGLHIGHVRNYAINDTIARFERQRGKNVLATIGWDSFGLPAENYAIKTGTPPAETTKANIVNFKAQLQRVGMSFDWTRELNTTDPKYYKWTQWIFLQLYKKGLAYQAENLQWWCPKCQTVLANEQVINGSYCWRHEDTLVEKRWLKQWFFKITDYAEPLLAGIDDLAWPEKIKTMQKNWIGKSEGAEISFEVKDTQESLKVFTTRPDTLFGATFMVLAPEHPLVNKITDKDNKPEVTKYITEAQKKSDVDRMNESREKTGVPTGAYAINPVNNEQIPIWIADYVLMGYGTGAIMAVPAHDERDHEFAKKYELPIIEVVEPETGIPQPNPEFRRSIVAVLYNPKTDKYLSINWGNLGGNLFIGGGIDEGEDIVECAKREIIEETGYSNVKFVSKTGKIHHNYFAHSKNVARKIEAHGLLFELVSDEVSEQNLEPNEEGKFTVEWLSKAEVEAKIKDELHKTTYELLVTNSCFTGEGISTNSDKYNSLKTAEMREKIVADLAEQGKGESKVNYRMRDWLISRQRYWGAPIPIVYCDKDGAVPLPEQDLPVILPEVESFEPKGDGKSVLASVEAWVNTTCPTCGGPAKRETDTMDGYACSSWYYLRYTDAQNDENPWDPAKANYWMPIDYYCGGDHAVSHLLYSRFWMHVFADMGLIDHTRKEPVNKLIYNGYINAADGQKMSKSKGNVVDPLELINQGYGADALRLYELFIAPYELDAIWDDRGIAGTYRFLNRVWTITQKYLETDKQNGTEGEGELLSAAHSAIKKVSVSLEKQSFNTAIAALMEYTNELYKLEAQYGFKAVDTWKFALATLTQLLAPFAPHITEELWKDLGFEGSVHVSGWPVHDESYLVQHVMTIAVQVNGKLRGEIEVPHDADQAVIEAEAKANKNVAQYLSDGIKKTIYVKGKILNFVV